MGPKGMPVVQSPGTMSVPAHQVDEWYQEIPTGLTALGMTKLVVHTFNSQFYLFLGLLL